MELIGQIHNPEVKVNTKLILMGATLPIKHNYLSAKAHLCTHLLIPSQRKNVTDNAIGNLLVPSP